MHHLDPPESIDSYYQEIGRAGRDGNPALAVLHVVTGRASARRFAAVSTVPDLDLHRIVAEQPGLTTIAALHSSTGAGRGRLLQAGELLDRLGAIRLSPGGELTPGPRAWEEIGTRSGSTSTDAGRSCERGSR